MVTSEECDMSGVFELETKKQTQCFNTIMTPIDKISKKDYNPYTKRNRDKATEKTAKSKLMN